MVSTQKLNANKQSFSANKSFYLLFVMFALSLFILLSLLKKIGPLTISHTVYYCQKVMSDFMITLPHSFPPLLVLMLSLVALTGFLLFLFQVIKTQYFIQRLLKKRIRTPKIAKDLALELGIAKRITVVNDKKQISFCYGLLNPKICLSNTIVNSLNKNELKAVLIHESYHLKSRDPLKILLSQIASSMFFFVPTIKDIQRHYILTKEINADQLVINKNGTKHLKFALVKLLSNPVTSVSGVASFASSTDLEQRIKILAGVAIKNTLNLSQIRLLLSFIVLGAALFLLNLPVYAVEDGMNDHELFMCPFGEECVVACQTQGISNDLFFSSKNNFSPLEISSHVPKVNQSVNPLP